ncbi:MAG: ABC transporter permease subunit [Armatimonadetes bacterium]|nr:ABC transporter permease subunit [Armatimonadota bacterium]
MRNILTIAGKELRSYFTSPMAYVLAVFYLGITGYIFIAVFLLMPQAQTEHMRDLISSMLFLALIIMPILTMGLFAQEMASGTMELLMTRPVRDWEVVVGKFLGAMGLFTSVIIMSLSYPAILAAVAKVDWVMILTGYLGLVLVGAAFVALGIFASSLTSNQIAAAILAVFMLLFFWLIGTLSYSVSHSLGDVFKHLSVLENYQDFSKGIIDTKNIIYFLSLIFVSLFLAVRTIENRRTI